MDVHCDTRFRLNALPDPLFLEPARTAVIVVDMQNAFVKKGGYFDAVGVDISRTRRIVPTCRRILDSARENGLTVLYLLMTETRDRADSDDCITPRSMKQKKKRDLLANRPALRETYYRKGTWGHRVIDELLPCSDDPIIEKHRHDGFIDTDLHAVLTSSGIEWLLFIGTATNICIESTLRHAFFLDYFAVIVTDAVSPMGPDMLQEATFANVQSTFGWITSSKDLLSGLHHIAPMTPSCRRDPGST